MTYTELQTFINEQHQPNYWRTILEHSKEILMQIAISNQFQVARDLKMSANRLSNLMPMLRELASTEIVQNVIQSPTEHETALQSMVRDSKAEHQLRLANDRWPTPQEAIDFTKTMLAKHPEHPHRQYMEAFIAGLSVEVKNLSQGWIPSTSPLWNPVALYRTSYSEVV